MLARGWDSDELYLVLRGLEQRAFPGTYVFPGGRIDAADAATPVRARDPEVAPEAYVAAARELFEETGVLLATRADGGPPDFAPLAPLRRALLAGETDFAAVLASQDLALDGENLVPLGEKTTPPFHPRRYRNRFFLAVLPEGQAPTVIPGELERGEWVRAKDAVAGFEAGRLRLSPPILLLCEWWGERPARLAQPDLARFGDEFFRDNSLRIRFAPEILLVPGRTPTLPPATHTNCYILGADRLLVVDPATPEPAEQAKLLKLIAELEAEGRRVEAVVLTHQHPDHIGAVEAVRAATGAPLWGHAITAELLPQFAFDRLLEDGETVELGAGGAVRFIHTPGHAPGHLCLFQEKHRGLIAGDMVSTASTILVDPDDHGDLAVYLASLRKLLALDAAVIHPSHGDAYPDAGRLLRRFLDHRQMREDKVLAALGETPRDLDELVATVYDDAPEAVWPVAKISLRAGLIKLAAEGRAAEAGGGWRATGAGR